MLVGGTKVSSAEEKGPDSAGRKRMAGLGPKYVLFLFPALELINFIAFMSIHAKILMVSILVLRRAHPLSSVWMNSSLKVSTP